MRQFLHFLLGVRSFNKPGPVVDYFFSENGLEHAVILGKTAFRKENTLLN